VLKITARQIVVGMGTGLLAGFLVVAFESYFPEETCEYDEHNQTPNHENCTVYSIFLFSLIQIGKALKAFNDYGAGITGIATVFLAIITAGLVFVAIDQSKTTRRQLRAYVFISDVKVLQFATIPRVTAEFKNFGQTPCDEITFSYNIKVDDFPLPKDLCIRPALGIAPMAPGFGFHQDNSLEVTQEQRSAIAVGNAAIYIFGRIEYRDVFKGPRRYTNFRQIYSGDQFGRTSASEEGSDYS
jgi:hypothetical protein